MEDSLRRFLADRSFDVAHLHHLTGLSTGFLDVLREAGIPSVLTLHDYWLMCPRGQMWHRDGHPCEKVAEEACTTCLMGTFPVWLKETQTARNEVRELHDLAREVLGKATRLITPSPRTIPFFAALGLPRAGIAVVENAVDTQGLAQVPPPAAAGPLRVGYLGTLIPSKGLDVLVDAVQRLPRGSVTLAVHGNLVPYHGDEGFGTRVFARLSPGAKVTYHGPYTGADLPSILAGIDVLAAPALWEEAFGLTVREAQAAGRPVVVSRIGGLQDAVSHGVDGMLVEPGDVDQLAQALADLAARRSDLIDMGAAGRRRVRGFDSMAKELVGHYLAAASLDPGTAVP
jgi:glycosyltransferase involved in cell wall biosynthesis